jgi:hypothetical protein
MPAHKFAVGQVVRFIPDRIKAGAAGRGEGVKIVRLLPEAAGVLQYRVQSQLDSRERVVREDQLVKI